MNAGAQVPDRQSSTLLGIAILVAWYGVHLRFANYRPLDVALAAILLVMLVNDVRQRVRR